MVLINIIAIHPNFLSSPFPHPCHSLFFSRDDLRSPSGIISGPGSFAIRDHLRSRDHLWMYIRHLLRVQFIRVNAYLYTSLNYDQWEGWNWKHRDIFFGKVTNLRKSRTFEGKFTLYNLDSIPILPWISKQKCLIIFQKI